MQPSTIDLQQVSVVETDYSLMVSQLGYGGLRFMPFFPALALAGTFYKYDQRDFFQTGDLKRAEDGEAAIIKWKPATDTYKCNPRAIKEFLSDIKEKAAQFGGIAPSHTATARITSRLMNQLERDIAAKLTSTSVLTQNTTLSGTTQFSDYLNSDPRGVFATARLAMKFLPYARQAGGSLIAGMAPEVFEVLRIHPDILAFLSLAENKVVSKEQLALAMGVDEVIILDALYDSASDAAASGTFTRIWGKDIVMAYVNPSKALDTMTLGWTPAWAMPGTAGINSGYPAGTPIRIRDYPDNATGGGGMWREGDCAYDNKVVMAELGYLIKAAVA